MLEMKCHKCETEIEWWPYDLFQPISDKRVCPSCGEEHELSNPAVCSVLNGLIFAGVMTALGLVGLGYQWLRVIAAGLVSWFVHPFLVAIFGRWRRRSYRIEHSSRARVLVIVGTIGGWIFGIAAVFTIISFALLYRDILGGLGLVEGTSSPQASEEFLSGLRYRITIGCAVAAVGIVISTVALAMRGRLRYVE